MIYGKAYADRRDVRISSYCTNGTCVGVLEAHGGVEVVDTKDPQGATLRIPAMAWAAFVFAVKTGEFDVTAS